MLGSGLFGWPSVLLTLLISGMSAIWPVFGHGILAVFSHRLEGRDTFGPPIQSVSVGLTALSSGFKTTAKFARLIWEKSKLQFLNYMYSFNTVCHFCWKSVVCLFVYFYLFRAHTQWCSGVIFPSSVLRHHSWQTWAMIWDAGDWISCVQGKCYLLCYHSGFCLGNVLSCCTVDINHDPVSTVEK